jgi:hypothetical protein
MDRSLILAVIRRPSLWGTALGTIAALAPDGWWRRPPFLPIPDPALVGWRLTTAYGSAEADLAVGDLVSYLEWRRRANRAQA